MEWGNAFLENTFHQENLYTKFRKVLVNHNLRQNFANNTGNRKYNLDTPGGKIS